MVLPLRNPTDPANGTVYKRPYLNHLLSRKLTDVSYKIISFLPDQKWDFKFEFITTKRNMFGLKLVLRDYFKGNFYDGKLHLSKTMTIDALEIISQFFINEQINKQVRIRGLQLCGIQCNFFDFTGNDL